MLLMQSSAFGQPQIVWHSFLMGKSLLGWAALFMASMKVCLGSRPDWSGWSQSHGTDLVIFAAGHQEHPAASSSLLVGKVTLKHISMAGRFHRVVVMSRVVQVTWRHSSSNRANILSI